MVFRATLKKKQIMCEILFGQMQENPRVTQIGYILGIWEIDLLLWYFYIKKFVNKLKKPFYSRRF